MNCRNKCHESSQEAAAMGRRASSKSTSGSTATELNVQGSRLAVGGLEMAVWIQAISYPHPFRAK